MEEEAEKMAYPEATTWRLVPELFCGEAALELDIFNPLFEVQGIGGEPW